MDSLIRPSWRVFTCILISVCLTFIHTASATPPTIRASAGSSVVLMNAGNPLYRLSGGLEIEAFRLSARQPARSAWIFELKSMQVPYPAVRRYATLPLFDTTTALFPERNDQLRGFGTGVRLYLTKLFGCSTHLRLTGGLCHLGDGLSGGGDVLVPRNPLYLYPSVVLNFNSRLSLTLGALITELEEPQAVLIPVEVGVRLL